MNHLASVPVGNRRLGWKASYAPGFDGVFLSNRKRDQLVNLAEIAHRYFTLWTNVGDYAFLLELSVTYSFYRLVNQREASPTIRAQKLRILGELLGALVRFYDSYEVTDETFSAVFAYSVLRSEKQYGQIRRLEQILLSYPAEILATYNRVRRLIDLIDIPHGLWIDIFLDAAAIRHAKAESDELFSCDERLEFYVTQAEKLMQRGISPVALREYYRQTGQKAGYKIGEIGTIVYPENLDSFTTVWEQVTKLRFPSIIKPEQEMNRIDQLRDEYQTIIKDRVSELKLSGQNRKRLDDNCDVLSMPKLHSFVYARWNGKAWELQASNELDNKSKNAWTKYALHLLLRDAVLKNTPDCPWSKIKNFLGDNPQCDTKRDRLCRPVTDERCVFRKLKRSLGESDHSNMEEIGLIQR